eukprot:535496-Rhodomonas_salina.1
MEVLAPGPYLLPVRRVHQRFQRVVTARRGQAQDGHGSVLRLASGSKGDRHEFGAPLAYSAHSGRVDGAEWRRPRISEGQTCFGQWALTCDFVYGRAEVWHGPH